MRRAARAAREAIDRQQASCPPAVVRVCRSCFRSSLVGGSVCRLALFCLESEGGAGAVGFRKGFGCLWVSRRFSASGGRSAAVSVRVCWHDSFVESPLLFFFSSAPSRSFSSGLAW